MSLKKDEPHATAAETLPADKEHLESPDVIPKPESIRDMSPEELKKLEKRMVRKMDMIIMPIMGILYILNCKSTPRPGHPWTY
jgi:hypothetical protein